MAASQGTLYVVATPIGNLDDISTRACAVLGSVSLIAAEDTRHTRQLLTKLGISNRIVSCHEHNELQRIPEILAVLDSGQDVALVSDAGTPLLSDPGFRVVQAVSEAGHRLSPIPGCNAAVAALSVAGLPTSSFSFHGSLPASQGARRAGLEALSAASETLVFYESVHRVVEVLEDMAAVLGGERQAVVAREITKLYETIYRGTLTELIDAVRAAPGKGEYTLVISGARAAAQSAPAEARRILGVLLDELPPAQAATLAARITGVARKELYMLAIQLRDISGDSA